MVNPSVTLASGYNIYFCGGSDGQSADTSSYSWTNDEVFYYSGTSLGSAVGHQTSNVCSMSGDTATLAVAGFGVDTPSSYSIVAASQSQASSQTISWSPSSSSAYDFMVFVTAYSGTSLSLSSGCSQIASYSGSSSYEFLVLCQGYASYSVTYSMSATQNHPWTLWAVYDVPP
jgi:hypothetical protein